MIGWVWLWTTKTSVSYAHSPHAGTSLNSARQTGNSLTTRDNTDAVNLSYLTLAHSKLLHPFFLLVLQGAGISTSAGSMWASNQFYLSLHWSLGDCRPCMKPGAQDLCIKICPFPTSSWLSQWDQHFHTDRYCSASYSKTPPPHLWSGMMYTLLVHIPSGRETTWSFWLHMWSKS